MTKTMLRFMMIVGTILLARAQELPLVLEPIGDSQAGRPAHYLARAPGWTARLASHELVLPHRQHPLRLHLAGARQGVPAAAEQRLPGTTSYLRGPRSEWRAGVPHFHRVRYRAVYPGIDLVYYGRGSRLEYDFVVQPGADPARVALRFPASERLRLLPSGDLELHTRAGILRQQRPVAYQEDAQGQRQPVAVQYVRHGAEVRFRLGSYDRQRPLTIDPVIEYGTLLGQAGGLAGKAVVVDGAGDVYVAGSTLAPGSADTDVVVLKYAPARNQIVYYTVLGGRQGDTGAALAAGSDGSVFVTGTTASADFPLQNALERETGPFVTAGFVLRLAADGQRLLYSTYLGGGREAAFGSWTRPGGIAVDRAGAAYVAGNTNLPTFPVRNAALPLPEAGRPATTGFLTKVSPAGDAIVYSSRIGAVPGWASGSASGVAVDSRGSAYVVGLVDPREPFARRAVAPFTCGQRQPGFLVGVPFLLQFEPDGSRIAYATCLGGAGSTDAASVAVDAAGAVYIAGQTLDPAFPTVNAFQRSLSGPRDAMVIKLSPAADRVEYSTYLGGTGEDFATALALDRTGAVYVVGRTREGVFPAVQAVVSPLGGFSDAFAARLDPQGRLSYATALGGGGSETATGVAVQADGAAWVLGGSDAGDLPLPGALRSERLNSFETFLLRLSGTGPSASAVQASPALVSLTAVAGGEPVQSAEVEVNGTTAASFTAVVGEDAARWLSVSPADGITPGKVQLRVDATGLAPGRYEGQVRVTSSSPADVAAIAVALTVLSAAPQLQSLTPDVVAVGEANGVLTLTGECFAEGATVRLHFPSASLDLPAEFLDAQHLRLPLPPVVTVQEADVQVSVANPGSARSNSVVLRVGRAAP